MGDCVWPFKSGVSVSPSPVGLLLLGTADLQSQLLSGLIFQAGEPDVGLRSLLCNNLCRTVILQFVGHSWGLVVIGFDYISSLPFLLHIFSCRRSFLVVSSLFHQWLFSRELWFCYRIESSGPCLSPSTAKALCLSGVTGLFSVWIKVGEKPQCWGQHRSFFSGQRMEEGN